MHTVRRIGGCWGGSKVSLNYDVFSVDPKPIPSQIPGFEEAVGQAKTELLSSDAASVEDRFAQMEKEDEIDRILNELKGKRGA